MTEQQRLEALAISDDLGREQNFHPRDGSWYTFVTPGPVFYGKLIATLGDRYILEDMAWVPDTGRAHEFVQNPNVANEVEYIGEGVVPRGAVLGVFYNPNGKKLETK